MALVPGSSVGASSTPLRIDWGSQHSYMHAGSALLLVWHVSNCLYELIPYIHISLPGLCASL